MCLIEILFISAKREEAWKAKILFVIVIFFVICNLPSTVLNLEELVKIIPAYYRHLVVTYHNEVSPKEVEKRLCYSPPFWALILGSISKSLLTLNASICTVIYCAMGQLFRSQLSNRLKKIVAIMRC